MWRLSSRRAKMISSQLADDWMAWRKGHHLHLSSTVTADGTKIGLLAADSPYFRKRMADFNEETR